MYRKSDLLLFKVLSSISMSFLMISAFLTVLLFLKHGAVYQKSAVVFLLFSTAAQCQIFIQKIELIEKRLSSILQPAEQLDFFTRTISPAVLAIYCFLFWLVAGALVFFAQYSN